MTLTWKIAAPIACALVLCGAAITWQIHKSKANEQKLADDAKASRASAERGDAKAEYTMGRLYYQGRGVSQDYTESARWYRKAGDQKYVDAESFLGFLYEQGIGVAQDYTEAILWYRKAADQGDAAAEYNLGTMYRSGKGVALDYVEAVKWYRKAADQDDPNGQYGLGYMYYNGEGVSQDYLQAANLYRRASDQGLARAQYDLAYMYYDGRAVPQDRVEASRLLHKAAEQGEKRAQRSLGINASGWLIENKLIMSITFLGSLFFIASSLYPSRRLIHKQDPARVAAGIIGLSYASLSLYASLYIGAHASERIAYAISFAESFLLGAFSTAIISIFWPKSSKFLFGLSVALFFAFNICAFTYSDSQNTFSAMQIYYSVNGILAGTSVPLAILLWRTRAVRR